METIDKKVERVLEFENQKMNQIDKDSIDKICESNTLFESIRPEYTISPKDTIGKNIYFNTIRK